MFISLVIFLFLLLYSYKEYKYIDYSLPTLHLLKKAAKRYKFFQGKSWWAIFALSIMEVGMILDNLEFNTLTLIVAFTLVMIGSLSAGAIWWYIRYKPMRDGALRLIHEIEKCEEE